MERERGDELPYGEPMKIPEHMDSTDLCPDGASEDDIRRAVLDCLDENDAEIDGDEFFEWIDPEGPFRYTGSFDAWDGIRFFAENEPRVVADVIREWVRQNGPMDPRRGPDQ